MQNGDDNFGSLRMSVRVRPKLGFVFPDFEFGVVL